MNTKIDELKKKIKRLRFFYGSIEVINYEDVQSLIQEYEKEIEGLKTAFKYGTTEDCLKNYNEIQTLVMENNDLKQQLEEKDKELKSLREIITRTSKKFVSTHSALVKSEKQLSQVEKIINNLPEGECSMFSKESKRILLDDLKGEK